MKTGAGKPSPLGASRIPEGWNFAIYTSTADSVTLVVFSNQSKDTYELNPDQNKTGDVWHISIDIPEQEFEYGYYIQPDETLNKGIPVNPSGLIPDPRAKAFSGLECWGQQRKQEIRSVAFQDNFDWEGDVSLKTDSAETIIYELHVRGFTRHENSGVEHKGTYKGLVEKIPYLQELGVTAVELLPVHEFDETDCDYVNPAGEVLKNYWGYNTIGFFAPKQGFASDSGSWRSRFNEFREMVKAFHRAGIEVILDVVYNHTAESDRKKHVYHYKALDNDVYYLMENNRDYSNYSGCGNTVRCNHPVVRSLILESLRFWVSEMHVDGFRFDLASILSRDEQGNEDQEAIILNDIARDPILADIKLIAEPWDASGMYQVGNFPHYQRWSEWNGKFRDVLRRYIAGEKGITFDVGRYLAGSPDMYQKNGRPVTHSVNFLTAHDGFTLHDLVSYNYKHNEDNGEVNRDGENQNHSFNYGEEGPVHDPEINRLREKQMRNFCTVLLLSMGMPMILAGDECARTQGGNNNTWNQDNPVSWFDWNLPEKNVELSRFWQKMIAFRKNSVFFRQKQVCLLGEAALKDAVHISFHGIDPFKPDFSEHSHSLGVMMETHDESGELKRIYMALNFWREALVFKLPKPDEHSEWKLVLNTDEPAAFLQGKVEDIGQEVPAVSVPSFSICLMEHN